MTKVINLEDFKNKKKNIPGNGRAELFDVEEYLKNFCVKMCEVEVGVLHLIEVLPKPLTPEVIHYLNEIANSSAVACKALSQYLRYLKSQKV